MNLTKEQEELKEYLSDERRRLFSWKLYRIKDKNAQDIPFIPNEHQEDLYSEKHKRNIIPKARQLWFSTFIDIYLLDKCLFKDNVNALIIAHDKESVVKIFQDKVKYAWDRLPDRLKNCYQVKTDRSNELSFSVDGKSWSTIRVASSGRSWTYQYVHISEFWKMCAKYPQKADEVNTGTLEAVPIDWEVYIESTAEWDQWLFYEWTMEAEHNRQKAKRLEKLEYKIHFYAWWLEEEYTVSDDADVAITQDYQNYFSVLENEYGIELTTWQKKWYILKHKQKKDKMKQEYPSVLKECFEVSIEWSYYWEPVAKITSKGQICRVPYDESLPVYTAFDLWWAKWWDLFTIWFFQVYWREARWIDYWEWNDSLKNIWNNLLPWYNYDIKACFLPRDWFVTQMWDWKTRASYLEEAWYTVHKIERTEVSYRIEVAKDVIPMCRFDEVKAWLWVRRLRNYRKKWNTKLWRYMEDPEHDINSHWADAFWYGCQAVKMLMQRAWKEKTSTSQQRRNISLLTRKPHEPQRTKYSARRGRVAW